MTVPNTTPGTGVVADTDIRVNGARLPLDARTDIESVTVLDDLSALSMFTLVLYNWDQEQLRVSWSDSSLFAIGAEVQIALGFVNDLHRVMTGEITSLEPAFTSDQPPMLTVRGYDYRHRLARGRKTRTFSHMKDSAIVSQVARGAGLRAQVKDTGTSLDYVVQHNQTDLEFLQKRAQLIGYELYVREKVLYFQPPQHAGRASVTLQVGRDLTEFTPRLRSLDQVGEMTVRGWDAMQKEVIVGSAATGQESTTMGGRASGPRRTSRAFGKAGATSVDVPVQTKARADQMARGRFDDMALTYIQGEAECAGHPRLHAGTVVDIQGAGETFSGAYYLTSVTHTVAPSVGYRTYLDVRRNAA
ncbi:MAG: phage late control D family protein [Gammaproteobacteria bacterium]